MASKTNRKAPPRIPGRQPAIPLWWLFPLALAAAGAVFSPALSGPFVFDDYHLPFADPGAAQMPARFWIGGARPLLMVTYWTNFLLSGTHTFSYHAVNLGLHAIAATLCFFLLQRLISLAGLRADPFWGALAGSGLFLLHPLQTEAVDYIAGRSEVVCAIFVLAGWLLFLRHFEEETSPRAAAMLLVCGTAAVLSKESGICLAALLAATDCYWRRGGLAAQFRRKRLLYVPILAGSALAAWLILRTLSRSATAGFSIGEGPLLYALTECRVAMLYLRLFALPLGQNADWQIPLYRDIGDGAAGIYAALVAALAAAICLLYKRARAVSFGLLILLLALLPTSSFVPIRDAMAERRMYLPIIGPIFAAIALVDRWNPPARILRPLAVSVLLVVSALSFGRSQVWGSDIRLWQDAAEKNPANPRAHSSLGVAFMLARDCRQAAREFRAAVELEGLSLANGRDLGAAYECSQQPELALATYQRLVKVHPESVAYARIGYLEALREHVDEALAAFDTALRLDPSNASAYAFRGVARIAVDDLPGAREDFGRALALDPGNQVATSWMAKLSHDR